MIDVRATPEFMASLTAALEHPSAPDFADFASAYYLEIVNSFRTRWPHLLHSDHDPYRRTLIATYPPGSREAEFFYSIRGYLTPDGVVELENFSIDWDFPVDPLEADSED